jgi:hypothetical protein
MWYNQNKIFNLLSESPFLSLYTTAVTQAPTRMASTPNTIIAIFHNSKRVCADEDAAKIHKEERKSTGNYKTHNTMHKLKQNHMNFK